MPPGNRSSAIGTSPAAPRPLRRDAEENRRRLLEAAREVFAEVGLEATMDHIAARAGVGVGTAYRRFADKDELIAALAEERIAELAGILDRALAEPDPWHGIVNYLEGWISLHAGDRGLKEMFLGSARGRKVLAEARSEFRIRLHELIARAGDAGALRPGIQVTDLLMAQVMLAALPVAVGDSAPETWRRFLPLVLDGLSGDRDGGLPGRALTAEEYEAAMARDSAR